MVPLNTSLLDRIARALPRSLAERLALARRDVGMVLDGIAGRTPSPVVRQHAIDRGAQPKLGARPVRVRALHRETDDAVSVELEDPTGAPFHYAPGQFFTVCVRVDGVAMRRAYSASRPADGSATVRITVKRVQGGAVSTHLTTRLSAGDSLELLGPSGSFTAEPSDGPRHLVLLGGGSGITPLFAIASHALARSDARVTLVYGNRAREDVIFADALDALAREHPTRFTLRHALERAHEGFDGIVGRLDAESLQRALDALGALDDAEYFLCGPTPMREAARATLLARGVDLARVREEVYASPHAGDAEATAEAVVQLRLRGRERAVTVRAGETILDAAMRAGVDLPFSCTVGGCGACQCVKVAGEVVMEEPNCLDARERDEGAVLTCVGRPRGPGVVLEVP